MDDVDFEGKTVVIVGSGASGVEAAELAVERKAKGITLLARCVFMILLSVTG